MKFITNPEVTNLVETDETLSGKTYTYDFHAYDNTDTVISAVTSTDNVGFVPTANSSTPEKYLCMKHVKGLSDASHLLLLVTTAE